MEVECPDVLSASRTELGGSLPVARTNRDARQRHHMTILKHPMRKLLDRSVCTESLRLSRCSLCERVVAVVPPLDHVSQ